MIESLYALCQRTGGVLNNFILRDLFNVAMFLWICHLVIHVNRNITELNTSLKKSCSLRCPLILGKGSHPLHAEADLMFLTNFLLIIENQNMPVTHQKVIFLCRHVRDVRLMQAFGRVLNKIINHYVVKIDIVNFFLHKMTTKISNLFYKK